jgi:hypothetical protein
MRLVRVVRNPEAPDGSIGGIVAKQYPVPADHPVSPLRVFQGVRGSHFRVRAEVSGGFLKNIFRSVINTEPTERRHEYILVAKIANTGDIILRKRTTVAGIVLVTDDGIPVVAVQAVFGSDPEKPKTIAVNTGDDVLREPVEGGDVLKLEVRRLRPGGRNETECKANQEAGCELPGERARAD